MVRFDDSAMATTEDSNTAGARRNGPEPARGDDLAREVRAFATTLGFAACGFADASGELACGPSIAAWLAAGRHASMDYLAAKHEVRMRPRSVLADATVVIVVAWRYRAPVAADPDWRRSLTGRVAAYALGADYHRQVASRLETLAEFLRGHTGAACVVHVDGGPLVEKELARAAGLGWYGRNTNILVPGLGSTFVLGCIVTSAPIRPDSPFVADHCGTCAACVAACPTGAIGDGPTIDARLCLSYLTIEHRGPLPTPLRAALGNWVFGCDDCQDPCPLNATAEEPDPFLRPYLPDWLTMTEEEFRETFAATALRRAKRRGLARNAAVALGNSGNEIATTPLARALREHDEPLVRAHAAWALGRLPGRQRTLELEAASGLERVPPVRREIEAALAVAGRATA